MYAHRQNNMYGHTTTFRCIEQRTICHGWRYSWMSKTSTRSKSALVFTNCTCLQKKTGTLVIFLISHIFLNLPLTITRLIFECIHWFHQNCFWYRKKFFWVGRFSFAQDLYMLKLFWKRGSLNTLNFTILCYSSKKKGSANCPVTHYRGSSELDV